MKSGGSAATASFGYDATFRCHFQTVALYQTLNPAFLYILFDLGLMVMIVAEGLIDLGGSELG
jgi:hypothetical protein